MYHHYLRCSYGTPHRHDESGEGDWQYDRDIGIASQSRKPVEKLLRDWAASDRNRRVQGIETREVELPVREDGHVWWQGPDDEDEEAEDVQGRPEAASEAK